MIKIVLAGSNLEEIQKKVEGVFSATTNAAILDEVGALLLNRIRTRFLSETSPSGSKWPPSKAALHRSKTGRGGGTLFDTGRLFHSLQMARFSTNQQLIGTDVPYANWVNYGTNRLPPRIFMDFNNNDLDLITKLVQARIQEVLS